MAEPNWANRTLYVGNNLAVMEAMNSATVDLIYLDPPFNSNADYAAPVGSLAAGAAFTDTWALDDIEKGWLGEIESHNPALYHTIAAAGHTAGESMQAYLTYMAVRLIEMHRLLKDTGSIYLHCDDTAAAYLKQLMDAVFGVDRCLNQIVWKRTTGRSDAKRYGRVHDVILFYTISPSFTWNTQYQPHDPKYVARAYRHEDERGRWQSADLTASGPSGGESGKPWRGIDPGKNGNHWRTPTKGGMNDFIIDNDIVPGWPHKYPGVHDRLDALDTAGLIAWPHKQDGMPRLKRYLASTKGTAVEDIFTDVKRLESRSKEKTGYPTQKPLALLERIILASSNENDIVFDPFAGCATTCVAAEKLSRRWVGCDLSELAQTLVKSRCESEVWCDPLFKLDADGAMPQVYSTSRLPVRTDIAAQCDPAMVDSADIKQILFDKQGGRCAAHCEDATAGLGREFPIDIFHIDHIKPRSKGGLDVDANKQLLCPPCNMSKGNRTMSWLLDKQTRSD